jgi:hypothetical protein
MEAVYFNEKINPNNLCRFIVVGGMLYRLGSLRIKRLRGLRQ